MAHVSGERCLETTTKEGTGILTVLGAIAGHRTLASVATTNADTFYATMAGGSQWQTALYTRNSATTFTPTTTIASSTGSEITWTAGTKEIWIDVPASKINVGPDGTVGAPAISFWNDPDLGFYRIGANQLGLSLGGTKHLDFSTTGLGIGSTLYPLTSDGAALGTTSLMFSDLFLASGSVINLNNGDVTLTHSSNTLTMAGGALHLTSASIRLSDGFQLEFGGAVDSVTGNGTSHTFQMYTNNAVALSLSSAQVLTLNQYATGDVTITAGGVVTSSSDARLKHVAGPFTRGLADILKMGRPVTYNLLEELEGKRSRPWTKDDEDELNSLRESRAGSLTMARRLGRSVTAIEDKLAGGDGAWDVEGYAYGYAGWIAQDVELGIPEAVGVGPNGMRSLSLRPIIAAQNNAIIELHERLHELEKR